MIGHGISSTALRGQVAGAGDGDRADVAVDRALVDGRLDAVDDHDEQVVRGRDGGGLTARHGFHERHRNQVSWQSDLLLVASVGKLSIDVVRTLQIEMNESAPAVGYIGGGRH
jgi:hypothetical protein